MQLPTDLQHLETESDLEKAIKESETLMVCCGRMGPMCVPVYGAMKELEESGEYQGVAFRDMAFDSPEAMYIRRHPMCRDFMGLPFTMYFKNGEAVKATSSIQSKDQIEAILKTL